MASSKSDYKKPQYIEVAAMKKFGKDIRVLGTTQDELNQFTQKIEHQALSASVPKEVGRIVVNIDCKSHANYADGCTDGATREKADDWYDEFEITSKGGESKSKSSSYQLQLTKSKESQIGANLNFSIGGSSFFNLAGDGGLSATQTKTETEQTTKSESNEGALSQEFQIVDRLKVPPRTKVQAKIITWAVTYEAKTRTKLSIKADTYVPVRYHTRLSQKFGGLCTKVGRLTAEDLLANEEKFECKNGIVSFEHDGKISYVGREVEIIKEKTDC
jgi:hypothetical protein